jgi:hypothetical protein
MYSSVLSTEEKVLIHAQRSAVISSDSTEGHETDYGELFKEATKMKNKS